MVEMFLQWVVFALIVVGIVGLSVRMGGHDE
jgi:hypothetical protein